MVAMALAAVPPGAATILSGVLIALLGIPHGSLDLHLISTRNQRLRELVIYIIGISFVLGLWLAWPSIVLMLFLLNSAWHFGDCDLRTEHKLKPVLALVYGVSILTVLIDPRDPTIIGIITMLIGHTIDASVVSHDGTIRVLASALVIGIPLIGHNRAPYQSVFAGLLIVAVSTVAPSLIAFTWYFVIVHSWTSMDRMRFHIDTKHPWTWRKLLVAAAPLSLLTYFAIAVSTMLISNTDTLSLLFIALSALTLPHGRLFHRVYHA